MSKTILITLPDFDHTTRYISAWAIKVKELAEKKNYKVIALPAERANRREFTSVIQKSQPDYQYLNGHGNANAVCGQNNEPLLEETINEHLCRDTIVYALSCSAGQSLGKAIVRAGAKAFIGYTNDYIFWHNHRYVNHPTDDELAGLFLEPSNGISTAIIKGHSVGEAVDKSKKMMRKNLKKVLFDSAYTQYQGYARFMVWNMSSLTYHGDREAKI